LASKEDTMIEKYNCSFVESQINEGGQLIDVRSPVEFNQGALEGAINMPIESFQYLKDAIDNTKPVLLYCRTGARSEMVKRYLEQMGFDQVHNIGGLRQFAGC
jgi:phage shock protein E